MLLKHRPRFTMAVATLSLSAWLGVPTLSAPLTLSRTYLDYNRNNTPLSTTRQNIFYEYIQCPNTATSCTVRVEVSAFVESVGTDVWADVLVDNSTSGIYARPWVKLTSGEGPSSGQFPSYTGVRTFSVFKYTVTPGFHDVNVKIYTASGSAWFLNGLMTVDVFTP